MKPTEPLGFATWMLEHLTFGVYDEALLGDLLEEFRQGRSVGWYWRQVFSAIRVGVYRRCRSLALPLIFSIGWSMLYPVWWLYVGRSQMAQTMFERSVTLDWPYSSILELAGGILPAVTFVWLGFFLYLRSRAELTRELSGLRLLGSLSVSLNVLLIATIGLLSRLDDHGMNLHNVTRENLYSNSSLIVAISVPLALSVLSAILTALPRARRQRHGADPLAG